MKESEERPEAKKAVDYARYSGLALQMLVNIGIFSFIGYKIDQRYGKANYIFTAILGVLGVVISLVQVIRALKKAD